MAKLSNQSHIYSNHISIVSEFKSMTRLQKIGSVLFLLGLTLSLFYCSSKATEIPTQEEMVDLAIQYDKVHGTHYADTEYELYFRSLEENHESKD